MTLKEAIEIGRAVGATTIGETAGVIMKLYSEFLLISDENWQTYCEEYASWRAAYEETFGVAFENCKI